MRESRVAIDLESFAREHQGRLPTRTAGADSAERALAVRLASCRAKFKRGALAPDTIAALDARVPGWASSGRGGAFEIMARSLAAYRREIGRWPNPASEDPDTRRLARWLEHARANLRSAALGASQTALLDELAPGWDATRQAEWRAQASRYASWRHARGRDPRRSRDADRDEAALAAWLRTQRALHRRGELALERQQWLDRHALGWDDTGGRGARWRLRCDELVDFCSRHHRLPSRRAGERGLQEWVRRQRAAHESGLLEPWQVQRLARAPGWDARVRVRKAEVQDRREQAVRLPSRHEGMTRRAA